MKVKELISALAALDPDLPVHTAGVDGMTANIKEVFVGTANKDGDGYNREETDTTDATEKAVLLLDDGAGF